MFPQGVGGSAQDLQKAVSIAFDHVLAVVATGTQALPGHRGEHLFGFAHGLEQRRQDNCQVFDTWLVRNHQMVVP
jgi:hypothetical protein